ncbi:multidrug resistance protein MdtN [Cupriavidus basilensis OR16]|uniref:Multidrug resistance protein MdtN n=1 Tax=Cupriavidus basilensis OR16 TaxID=1127483 RepID=H1S246_9BURK|nr:multidrug transporter subunit MdtN [Cupriavidus basilensis]EHP43412.1 multidrug resistance protein MdtN [Cupriavidus basilensis OR16]
MEGSAHSQKKKWLTILLLVTAIGLGILVIWRVNTEPRTDDAFVYADTINVVPEVSGRIVNLAVRDNQRVKKGDLLFELDRRSFQDLLDKARASLVQLDQQIMLAQRSVNAQVLNASGARAGVDRARSAAKQAADTLRRMEPLVEKGYVSADELDRARTSARSTAAELEAAELKAREATAAVSGVDALLAQRVVVQAEIASAELNLEFATVRAPFDGVVVSLRTTRGQFASASSPVFTLIDTTKWYVIANLRETELASIRPGTRTTVYLMSKTAVHFEGEVDSIGYGVAPDDGGSLAQGLPKVQRSLNWVHVSQRFPVRIRIKDPNPDLFRVGTSAVATFHPTDRGDRRIAE